MKALLDGGVQTGRDLNLAFGITLTAEHIAALTQDIIWYEKITYQGRTVLVPKLYLASATRAAVRAKFDNKGAVLAGTNVTVTADTIFNDKGIITASNDVNLTATGDVTSTSAEIIAGNDIALTSTDGNVQVQTQVDVHRVKSGAGANNVFSIQHERSKVTAGGSLTVAANDTIAVLGSDIASTGNTTLTAGKAVDIGVVEMRRERHFGSDTIKETNNVTSTAVAGGTFTVASGGAVTVKGSQIDSGGDVSLAAVDAVTIESSADTYDGVGQSKKGNSELHVATNTASSISADGDVAVTSGADMRVTASRLEADGDLSLRATGNVTVESAADGYNFQGRKYKLKTITQKASKLEAQGDVTVGSLVGDMSIISSNVNAGGDLTLTTPNGTLYLGARKNYFEEHISETKNGTFMSTYTNRGQIDETVVPTLLTANGNLAIVTGDGVIVDYKDTGNLGESIDQLAQAPGLAWMNDLRARDDITWNAVQEAHQSWNYQSQGISPTGAVMIAIAVGYVTAGMGSQLAGVVAEGSTTIAGSAAVTSTATIGSTVSLAAGGSATVVSGSTAAMVNAGFTSLVSQAATALVGNGGDIGAALKQLGSSNTLKALATSMVTAGMIEGLNLDAALASSTDKLSGSALKMTEFTNSLKIGLAQGTISATVDSVINGAPLGENLKGALVNAALTSVSQVAFKGVGDLGVAMKLPEGSIKKVMLHALTGCAVGQAQSGNCMAGAMAAGLQELAGDNIKAIAGDPAKQAELAGLIGALAVTLNGGDASAISSAANIAETANAFNRQLHTKEIQAIQGMAAEMDGQFELSAEEWETLLGHAALRRVDQTIGATLPPVTNDILNGVVESSLNQIITERGPSFVQAYGETVNFLKRDNYYKSSLTFSANLVENKKFYDGVLGDWAVQTYGGPLPTGVSPSQLALAKASLTAGGGCGRGFASCGPDTNKDIAILDPIKYPNIAPEVAKAMNQISATTIRKELEGTWKVLDQTYNDANSEYLQLDRLRRQGDSLATQEKIDAALARRDRADQALKVTYDAAHAAMDVTDGVVARATLTGLYADAYDGIAAAIDGIDELPASMREELRLAAKGTLALRMALSGDETGQAVVAETGEAVITAAQNIDQIVADKWQKYQENKIISEALVNAGRLDEAAEIDKANATVILGVIAMIGDPRKPFTVVRDIKAQVSRVRKKLDNNLSISVQTEEYEKSLVGISAGERVAKVKTMTQAVAASRGWPKDNKLSTLNNRDVYRGDDGYLYSVDTLHGRFEKIHPKRGSHLGEFNIDMKYMPGSLDSSGKHNLKVK